MKRLISPLPLLALFVVLSILAACDSAGSGVASPSAQLPAPNTPVLAPTPESAPASQAATSEPAKPTTAGETPTLTPAPPPSDTPIAPSPLVTSSLAANVYATVVAALPTPGPGTATPEPGGGGIEGVQVIRVRNPFGDDLYAAYSVGTRSFDPEQHHFVALYAHGEGAWVPLARIEIENADYLPDGGVSEASISDDALWLGVESGAGAHGGCFDLLSYDGKALRNVKSHCSASPGAAELRDLDGDGRVELVLNETDPYIFCYACSVRKVNFGVYRWDGSRMVEVKLAKVDGSPALNAAVGLAEHELWKDAQAAASAARDEAPSPQAKWDVALIALTAKAREAQAHDSGYPLLDNVFYGDYDAAVKVMRQYTPGQIFSKGGKILAGTPAEGEEEQLSKSLLESTALAIEAKPNLAAAHFLRGWGLFLANPSDARASAEVARAAQLEPADGLYSGSGAYLKNK